MMCSAGPGRAWVACLQEHARHAIDKALVGVQGGSKAPGPSVAAAAQAVRVQAAQGSHKHAPSDAYEMDDLDSDWQALLNELDDRMCEVGARLVALTPDCVWQAEEIVGYVMCGMHSGQVCIAADVTDDGAGRT